MSNRALHLVHACEENGRGGGLALTGVKNKGVKG